VTLPAFARCTSTAAERRFAAVGPADILAAILEFTFTRYFFHPENDCNGFLDPKNLGEDTKFITPRQMQMELFWM